MVFHHGSVGGAKFGPGRFESDTWTESSKEFSHAVYASGDHGGRQMMRAGDDVGYEFCFRRIGNRWLKYANHDSVSRLPGGWIC